MTIRECLHALHGIAARMRALPVVGLFLLATAVCGCPSTPDPAAPPRGVCAQPELAVLSLDPDADGPQIHPAAAWDGEALQVVWNGPRDPDSGDFAVRKTRLLCDGSAEAIQILDPGALGSDVDPSVAVSAGRTLVAWQSDDGGSPYNLSIGLVTAPVSGDPDRPWRTLQMQRNEQPYEGNAWMPRLADDAGGGFVLAGSRGIDAVGRFQGFVQALDLDGEPFGPSEDAGIEFEVSQVEPAIAVRANRTRILGWEERPDAGQDKVVWRELLPDGLGPASQVADMQAEAELGPLARVAIAVERSPREAVLFVAHGGSGGALDVTLEVVDRGDGLPGPTLVLGRAQDTEHTPGIALGTDGGVLVYHRVLSGFANELVLQRFRLDGDPDAPLTGITMDDPQVVQTDEPVAPYPPSITWIDDSVWFLAWSEGSGAGLRVRGRFVVLD